MQRYDQLFEPYCLDDWSAAEDAVALASSVRSYIRWRGFTSSLTHAHMTRQILQYIWMRQRLPWHEISAPQHKRSLPAGWTPLMESVWRDCIDHKCEIETWKTEVLDPVFGSDDRTWEAYCPGWRDEIFSFLPYWIERSAEKFADLDPTPLPDPEPEEKDPRLAKIDPYLLEHGRRGRRIKGVRTFE